MMDPVISMCCGRGWRWEARDLERETGFEPATSTLARSHSTTELLPLTCLVGVKILRVCSGFRRAAQTPRNRLKLLPLGSIDYKQALTQRQRQPPKTDARDRK